jgi:hypothetical protein
LSRYNYVKSRKADLASVFFLFFFLPHEVQRIVPQQRQHRSCASPLVVLVLLLSICELALGMAGTCGLAKAMSKPKGRGVAKASKAMKNKGASAAARKSAQGRRLMQRCRSAPLVSSPATRRGTVTNEVSLRDRESADFDTSILISTSGHCHLKLNDEIE